MKFLQLKIVPFFKKNIEVLLLISLLIVSIFITQLYNVNTKKFIAYCQRVGVVSLLNRKPRMGLVEI